MVQFRHSLRLFDSATAFTKSAYSCVTFITRLLLHEQATYLRKATSLRKYHQSYALYI